MSKTPRERPTTKTSSGTRNQKHFKTIKRSKQRQKKKKPDYAGLKLERRSTTSTIIKPEEDELKKEDQNQRDNSDSGENDDKHNHDKSLNQSGNKLQDKSTPKKSRRKSKRSLSMYEGNLIPKKSPLFVYSTDKKEKKKQENSNGENETEEESEDEKGNGSAGFKIDSEVKKNLFKKMYSESLTNENNQPLLVDSTSSRSQPPSSSPSSSDNENSSHKVNSNQNQKLNQKPTENETNKNQNQNQTLKPQLELIKLKILIGHNNGQYKEKGVVILKNDCVVISSSEGTIISDYEDLKLILDSTDDPFSINLQFKEKTLYFTFFDEESFKSFSKRFFLMKNKLTKKKISNSKETKSQIQSKNENESKSQSEKNHQEELGKKKMQMSFTNDRQNKSKNLNSPQSYKLGKGNENGNRNEINNDEEINHDEESDLRRKYFEEKMRKKKNEKEKKNLNKLKLNHKTQKSNISQNDGQEKDQENVPSKTKKEAIEKKFTLKRTTPLQEIKGEAILKIGTKAILETNGMSLKLHPNEDKLLMHPSLVRMVCLKLSSNKRVYLLADSKKARENLASSFLKWKEEQIQRQFKEENEKENNDKDHNKKKFTKISKKKKTKFGFLRRNSHNNANKVKVKHEGEEEEEEEGKREEGQNKQKNKKSFEGKERDENQEKILLEIKCTILKKNYSKKFKGKIILFENNYKYFNYQNNKKKTKKIAFYKTELQKVFGKTNIINLIQKEKNLLIKIQDKKKFSYFYNYFLEQKNTIQLKHNEKMKTKRKKSLKNKLDSEKVNDNDEDTGSNNKNNHMNKKNSEKVNENDEDTVSNNKNNKNKENYKNSKENKINKKENKNNKKKDQNKENNNNNKKENKNNKKKDKNKKSKEKNKNNKDHNNKKKDPKKQKKDKKKSQKRKNSSKRTNSRKRQNDKKKTKRSKKVTSSSSSSSISSTSSETSSIQSNSDSEKHQINEGIGDSSGWEEEIDPFFDNEILEFSAMALKSNVPNVTEKNRFTISLSKDSIQIRNRDSKQKKTINLSKSKYVKYKITKKNNKILKLNFKVKKSVIFKFKDELSRNSFLNGINDW
ncbi:hypothetical protein M0812_23890 [Anaeramoeba flamelloides]|uniref:RanBD1 domain-containing protein n=1 Tax=Anaeramoeba flamelloides TaxID=1746091 RepID=A0AAV7YJ87_9EUKA|nr:hypothetical protein M0812_23890 [Anaeramoeba flamelloides]